MSRRESRASLNSRQNDALFEFESFKKKFLLANKHITKLNSTLSVRIEELNAQISTLYVENLRLRASEIALAAQLKREKEKTRKVMSEAEAATLNLTKHLNYLRESLNIQEATPTPPSPPSPRARRPPAPSSPISPQGNRISRPPNISGIHEEEEPLPSSSEQDPAFYPSPARRKSSSKSKPRLSASKLPLPTRTSSPPPLPTTSHSPAATHVDLAALASTTTTKRKTSRRQSGMLTVNTEALPIPRPASPAFGSPIRLQAGRAEEEEEYAAIRGEVAVEGGDDVLVEAIEVDLFDTNVKKERKKSSRSKISSMQEPEVEPQARGDGVTSARSSKRQDDGTDVPKFKLKDVTNSRSALQPIDNTVYEPPEEPTSAARPFLAAGTDPTSRPNSRGSTSPVPPLDSDPTSTGIGGRERRARKSVNYAEPKLNTKMRKPDPPLGTETTVRKKRSSAASAVTSSSRRQSGTQDGDEADNDTEARSSLEQPALPLRSTKGGYVDPELFPLPPSRPNSNIAGSYSPGPSKSSGTSSSSSAAGSSTSGSVSIRKRKSRPQMFADEDAESDGAEADGEYIPLSQRPGWVNSEGRRKIAAGSSASRRSAVLTNVSGDEARRTQEMDGRRHSMAV